MLTAAVESATGKRPARFKFPKQAIRKIKPVDVFWTLRLTYMDIAEFFSSEQGYEPIIAEDPRTGKISPGDVFDLVQIIVGELKVLLGGAKSLNEETQAEYEEWRSSKEHILPGDVYNLVRYNQRLALSLVR